MLGVNVVLFYELVCLGVDKLGKYFLGNIIFYIVNISLNLINKILIGFISSIIEFI